MFCCTWNSWHALQVGYTCTGACEKDPYCQQVLKQHFPDVPLHDEILTLDLVKHGKLGDGDRLDTVIITTP